MIVIKKTPLPPGPGYMGTVVERREGYARVSFEFWCEESDLTATDKTPNEIAADLARQIGLGIAARINESDQT